MQEQDWKRWLQRLHELSPQQRQALAAQLSTPGERERVLAQIHVASKAKPSVRAATRRGWCATVRLMACSAIRAATAARPRAAQRPCRGG